MAPTRHLGVNMVANIQRRQKFRACCPRPRSAGEGAPHAATGRREEAEVRRGAGLGTRAAEDQGGGARTSQSRRTRSRRWGSSDSARGRRTSRRATCGESTGSCSPQSAGRRWVRTSAGCDRVLKEADLDEGGCGELRPADGEGQASAIEGVVVTHRRHTQRPAERRAFCSCSPSQSPPNVRADLGSLSSFCAAFIQSV
jgi:hypothetical protein